MFHKVGEGQAENTNVCACASKSIAVHDLFLEGWGQRGSSKIAATRPPLFILRDGKCQTLPHARCHFCFDTGGCIVASSSHARHASASHTLTCADPFFPRSLVPAALLQWLMKLQSLLARRISYPLLIMHRQQWSCPARLFINSTVG